MKDFNKFKLDCAACIQQSHEDNGCAFYGTASADNESEGAEEVLASKSASELPQDEGTTFSSPNFAPPMFKGSHFIARRNIPKLTRGALTIEGITNLDNLGFGPSGRVKIERYVAYEITSLFEWLRSRSVKIDPNAPVIF